MTVVKSLFERNLKIFFKDKGLFFTSLITPGILLLLYSTFLSRVFEESILMLIPEGCVFDRSLIKGCVSGQMISSILAVSSVTVSFCSNMLMVQDKANNVYMDLTVSPVKRRDLSLAYYFSTLFSSLIVCFTAAVLCFVYCAFSGWYLSVFDVILILLDVFLLVMFGTALSSVINSFLSTQGQISAIGSLVSSCYGFICGAYMPISQFSVGLRNVIMFLPGTYGTALIRRHSLQGVLSKISDSNIPNVSVEGIRNTLDYNLYFFDKKVTLPVMYIVLCSTVALLLCVYILINKRRYKNA